MAKIFTDCGFDAVTIANNHMYDFGPEALLDTRALLLEKGIAATGAGGASYIRTPLPWGSGSNAGSAGG